MARNTKNFIATMLAATIAASAIALPAHAGQLSINLSPANAEQQRMINAGLGFYALVEGIENGSITQDGARNVAGLMQGGKGNLGIIHQEGDRHHGTISQQNGGNTYGLFQFGKGTHANVSQSGKQSGLGFIFGW